MILKNLWRRKTRTFLTVLGIAVGVAAVVSLSAFGEGFASGLDRTFSSSRADLTVSQKSAMIMFFSALDEELGSELRQISGVQEVVGTVTGLVQMPDSPYFVVKGEDPRGFPMEYYKIVEGAPVAGSRQAVLGVTAAKNLKKQVGDPFRINDFGFTVVGIYETGIAFEDGGAVIGLADAQRVFDKRGKVSYFSIKAREARRIDQIKNEIEELEPKTSVARSGEATRQTEVLDMYRSFGWFLGIFAALVGGLGMMNTTLMSVFERTREIGVLRAVGWRRRRVVGLILGESLTLALFGGVLGIALGLALTTAAALSPSVGSILQGVYTPGLFLNALLLALGLGALGGVYPAWRAAQLDPIEAMRYEGGARTAPGRVARTIGRIVPINAVRNLLRRPTRTLVTTFGLGLGVGFVVALIAMVDGMEKSFADLLSAGQTDLMAEQANASDMSVSEIDQRTADLIAARPEVKNVSSIVVGTFSEEDLAYVLVFGVDPREEYAKHFRIREGRMVQKNDEVMLGRSAANSLKKAVGDSLNLGGSKYKVVGIYENGQVYEDVAISVTLQDAQQQFGKNRKATFLAIGLNDPSRAAEVARELEREYPEVMVSQASEATQRMQDFASTRAILDALVALTVVVGGIVMMNSMLMSVFERTQEIGLLRALGWRRRRIIEMVLIESVLISLLSCVFGIVFGLGLGYLIALEPSMGAMMKPLVTPDLFVQVIVLGLTLGALGGFYPAWRGSGLSPIEALRHE